MFQMFATFTYLKKTDSIYQEHLDYNSWTPNKPPSNQIKSWACIVTYTVSDLALATGVSWWNGT